MVKKSTNSDAKTNYTRPLVVVGVVVFGIIALAVGMLHRKSMYGHKDACDLFSVTDAQKVSNDTFIKDSSSGFGNQNLASVGINARITGCSYTHQSYSGGTQSYAQYINSVDKSITINVVDGHDQKAVSYVQKVFNATRASTGTEAVSDIGDIAFYKPADGQLSFLYKNYFVGMTFTATPESTHKQTHDKKVIEQIAKVIIANIKR